MLPQVGSTELLVIAMVALIVIGPKDLPMLLRKLGQFMGRLRTMADDFRSSFDEMARQSELDELRNEVRNLRDGVTFDTPPTATAETAAPTVEPPPSRARRASGKPRARPASIKAPTVRRTTKSASQ